MEFLFVLSLYILSPFLYRDLFKHKYCQNDRRNIVNGSTFNKLFIGLSHVNIRSSEVILIFCVSLSSFKKVLVK